jgi:hypothetical protein
MHHYTFSESNVFAQCQPFTWNGSFSKESVIILAQHANQGKLTGAETALARWLVYVHTHCDLPLDYRVFHPILEKIQYALQHRLLHQEDVSIMCYRRGMSKTLSCAGAACT